MINTGCIEENIDKNKVVINNEGNWQSIQNAIDNASKGDTIFIYNGVYKEKILVDKQLIIKGENKDKTILYYEGNESEKNHIIEVKGHGCIIKNLSINGNKSQDRSIGIVTGISVTSINNEISNVNIVDCYYGISFESKSDNNIILGNTLLNNKFGIWLWASSYNTIASNNVSYSNFTACYIGYKSNNNDVRSNTFFNNSEGIRIKDSRGAINNNVLSNMIVENK
jgi:parallel beta-helix repeat protein